MELDNCMQPFNLTIIEISGRIIEMSVDHNCDDRVGVTLARVETLFKFSSYYNHFRI